MKWILENDDYYDINHLVTPTLADAQVISPAEQNITTVILQLNYFMA